MRQTILNGHSNPTIKMYNEFRMTTVSAYMGTVLAKKDTPCTVLNMLKQNENNIVYVHLE